MEKQSRAASWGVRTVSGPFVAAGGVIVYLVFGVLSFGMSESAVNVTRYLADRSAGRDGSCTTV